MGESLIKAYEREWVNECINRKFKKFEFAIKWCSTTQQTAARWISSWATLFPTAVARQSSRKASVNSMARWASRSSQITRAQASSTIQSHSGLCLWKQARSSRPAPRKSDSCNLHIFRKNPCFSNRSRECIWICKKPLRCSDRTWSTPRTCVDPSRLAQ